MGSNPQTEAGFYSTASATSDLSRHSDVVEGFGSSAVDAARTACNVVIHVAAVERMRLKLPQQRWEGLDVRSAARIVDHVRALKDTRLVAKREPADRMIGNCHHITLLTCALLRHIGIPARARVGFASYLEEGKYVDHWVCETLDRDGWHRFDPDGLIDLVASSARRFLTGGEAWLACRAGDADPEIFGIDDAGGWWFIRNNVVRDFAALCKVELLPWDWWGLMVGQESDRPDDLIDDLSTMCADDSCWMERNERFGVDSLLNPNGRVFVFRGGANEVDLPEMW